MGTIQVTFEDLRNAAIEIDKDNSKLYELLLNIQKAITDLEADYTSDASDEIRAKIVGMQPKFESYKEVIESYSKFLRLTADAWQGTVQTLTSNASQFP